MSKGFYTQEQQYDAAYALAEKHGHYCVGRWPEDDRIEADRAARIEAQRQPNIISYTPFLFETRNKPE